MANRLQSSTSPYLQQHADNPVDWWEWGPEAFAEAVRREVPVLLSIGYAACHWCHVMAHESFEDESIATLINTNYVAIKVDREERPDIDAVYMSATTALTGQGGWPMTCLLTPEAAPFWAGTYLPPENFRQLLMSAAHAWRNDPDRVREGGMQIVTELQRAHDNSRLGGGAPQPLSRGDLADAARTLAADYDAQWGGFGGAPKFPPSMVLAFLLRHHGRTGDAHSLEMVRGTCEAMARSGTYDQIGGGFARYAVDRAWVVPHFEKMLYDNALLLGVYTDLTRADESSRPWAEPVVRETIEWLLQEMWTPQAAFASSLDADTEGQEGLTYVWTPHQLIQALGEEDGQRAADLLGVTPTGTFEHGSSTLQLRHDPEDPTWWAGVRERLAVHRTLRPQPPRDDKVITAWNGLLIASLAHAGWVFDEPDWIDIAQRCARFLLDVHVVDGRVRRSSRDGQVGHALGVAEDYGGLVDGLLALHRVTGEGVWLAEAGALLAHAETLFGSDDGGFSPTGTDAERLILRPRGEGDNAEPGGTSSLVLAFTRHGSQAGNSSHLERAQLALATLTPMARQAPRFAGWALVAAEELVAGPVTVRLSRQPESSTIESQGLAGSTTADHRMSMAQVARQAPASALVLCADEGTPALDDQMSATVCQGTVCDLPTADPDDLRTALAGAFSKGAYVGIACAT